MLSTQQVMPTPAPPPERAGSSREGKVVSSAGHRRRDRSFRDRSPRRVAANQFLPFGANRTNRTTLKNLPWRSLKNLPWRATWLFPSEEPWRPRPNHSVETWLASSFIVECFRAGLRETKSVLNHSKQIKIFTLQYDHIDIKKIQKATVCRSCSFKNCGLPMAFICKLQESISCDFPSSGPLTWTVRTLGVTTASNNPERGTRGFVKCKWWFLMEKHGKSVRMLLFLLATPDKSDESGWIFGTTLPTFPQANFIVP